MAFVERASCPFLRQARCPLPNPTHSLWNGHLARSGGRQNAHSPIQLTLCGTGILPVLEAGKMPAPKSNLLFVERASCPFLRQARCPPQNPTQTQTFTAFSKGKPSFSRCSK